MHTKTSKLGAALWLLSLQYYIAQLVVAATWQGSTAFSWLHNTISDLGNTVCGQYGDRFVCSPQHTVMNASFILLGLTMISGSLLLARQPNRLITRLGYGGLVLAGAGTILVGLFPENTVSQLHVLGAALPFLLGNVAIIAIGTSFKSVPLRRLSFALGSIGLVALVLFLTHHTPVVGFGGMERLVAYPQSIWMIIVGAYWLLVSSSVANDSGRGAAR